VSDAKGNHRLDDPTDFVRIEVELALSAGILVVPVLVSGTAMPVAEELPTSLRPLVLLQGIQIRPDPDFHRDMDRLIARLAEKCASALGPKEHAADAPPQGPSLHGKLITIEREGDVFVVGFPKHYWSDEKNQQACDELLTWVEQAGCRKLVLSLKTIEYGPSTLYATLIKLLRKIQKYDGRLILCDLKPWVREVFGLHRLDGIFEFAEDREGALARLDSK
jgi:anti-anti-sigma factor